MKNYIWIAAVWALFLGNSSLAYAQTCVDLSKAQAVAAWGLHANVYSQGDRSCTACTSQYPSGMPGATIPGPPAITGECCSYDCSSFSTWIVRQVPGQTGVPAAPAWPPTTFTLWGPGSSPTTNGSPKGWAACDPTKQPLCVGLTEWGGSGPDHAVTALCGKVYSASCNGCGPDITSDYSKLDGALPAGATSVNSGQSEIVWVTPPGLESASMNSCAATCSPGTLVSALTGVSGGAGTSSSDTSMTSMMEDMMMMQMMSQMMSGMSSPASAATQAAQAASTPLTSALTSALGGTSGTSTGTTGTTTGTTGTTGTTSTGTTTGSTGTTSSSGSTGTSTGTTGSTGSTTTASPGASIISALLAALLAPQPSSTTATPASSTEQPVSQVQQDLNAMQPADDQSEDAAAPAPAVELPPAAEAAPDPSKSPRRKFGIFCAWHGIGAKDCH